MKISMRVADPVSIERDVDLPRYWKIDRNESVDGFLVYDDYYRLTSDGVRTHISRRQPAYSGAIEYALRTEFITDWWKRSSRIDEEFFGLARMVPTEEIAADDFDLIETELLSHIEVQRLAAAANTENGSELKL